jgi:hypothetical protein
MSKHSLLPVLVFVLICPWSGRLFFEYDDRDAEPKTAYILVSTAWCSALPPQTAAAIPDPMIFVKIKEPKEGAFSLLAPKGWISQGGIFYVDPNTTNGYANSVGPKGNFLVKSNEAGTVMLHWLPDYYYCDTRFSPAGQMGLFQPGSYYNGMYVMPCPSAREYLLRFIFPQLRPDASQVKVLSSEALPEVVARYRSQSVVPGATYDASRVVVSYQQNSVTYKEQMSCAIENLGQMAAGMWQNKQTFCARAPLADYAGWEKVGAMIYASVKFDPQWLAAVQRATNQRTQNAQATQRYIQDVDRQITENRMNTNAEIRHGSYLLLTGQEDYLNPYTGETEIRPDGWQNHWENSRGEVIVSNLSDYNPNQDESLRLVKDFKRSALRPR